MCGARRSRERAAAQFARDFQPVHADVEQDHVRLELERDRQALAPGVRDPHLVPVVASVAGSVRPPASA